MIIELFGNKHITVSDEMAAKLDRLLDLKIKPERIQIDGQKVKFSEITNLWTDEQWAIMQHEAAGDKLCGFGKWHPKHEPCGHRNEPRVEEALNLDYLRNGEGREGESEVAKRWKKLIKLNSRELKATGKFGSLRTLEELDRYELDGQWPPQPPRKPKTRTVMRPAPAGAFPTGDKPQFVAVEVPTE